MNNDEAKKILSAYRPEGADAGDPFFEEALEQARNNPELARWLESQQAFDQGFHLELSKIPPPTDLKDKILAQKKTIQLRAQDIRPMPDRTYPRKLLNTNLWAIAAALILAIAIAGTFLPAKFSRTSPSSAAGLSHSEFISLAHDLVEGHKDEYKFKLGKHSENRDDLRAWLARQNSPDQFAIRGKLTEQQSLGCQVFDFGQTRVSLVCFLLENQDVVHLFVVGRDKIVGLYDETTMIEKSGVSGFTWADDKHVYFLVGRGIDGQTLRKLI